MATEFDELNVLEKNVDAFVENVESIANEPNRAMMRDEIEDDLEDLLIMAYAMGNDYAKRVLGIEDEQANNFLRCVTSSMSRLTARRGKTASENTLMTETLV
jgi:hypothetical protein